MFGIPYHAFVPGSMHIVRFLLFSALPPIHLRFTWYVAPDSASGIVPVYFVSPPSQLTRRWRKASTRHSRVLAAAFVLSPWIRTTLPGAVACALAEGVAAHLQEGTRGIPMD